MDIDRNIIQFSPSAIERVKFCLDTLEKQNFSKGISWETSVTKRLTIEEIIGALVSAEQKLKEVKEVEDYADYIEEMKRIGKEASPEHYKKWRNINEQKNKF